MKIKYQVQFQYTDDPDQRPQDYGQIDQLYSEENVIMIPSAGDSVSLKLTSEKVGAYKVLTRHFNYLGAEMRDQGPVMWCHVNIVVTDMDGKEMSRRLKE